jgi:Peptidase dimerisation domain
VCAPTEAELRAIAEQSDSIEPELRDVLGVDEFMDGLTGAPFRERLSFGPTCNIAGIKAGSAGPGMKTVLPAETSAWLDFRLVPDQHPDEILALEITVLGAAEPAGTPIEHPFVHASYLTTHLERQGFRRRRGDRRRAAASQRRLLLPPRPHLPMLCSRRKRWASTPLATPVAAVTDLRARLVTLSESFEQRVSESGWHARDPRV